MLIVFNKQVKQFLVIYIQYVSSQTAKYPLGLHFKGKYISTLFYLSHKINPKFKMLLLLLEA